MRLFYFSSYRLLGVILLIVGALTSYCQNQNQQTIDSLKKELTVTKQDTNKVKILLQLSKRTNCTDTQAKFLFIHRAFELAQGIKWRKGVEKCYDKYGDVYCNCLNDYDRSIFWAKKCLEISIELNDTIDIGGTMNEIGVYYAMKPDYINAIDYYKRALASAPTLSQVSILANMGNAYHSLGDFSIAINCYESSYNILHQQIISAKRNTINDTSALMGLLLTIADVYTENSQTDKALTDYKQLLVKSNSKEKDVAVFAAFKAAAFSGIGKCWYLKKDYDSALAYYKKALQNPDALGLFRNEAYILNETALAYLTAGNIDSSIYYAVKSWRVAGGSAENEQI